jgi:hypothetical protein
MLSCCHAVVTLPEAPPRDRDPKGVTLLAHCCYTVVTLLLHCCCTGVTLLLHSYLNCCYTVVYTFVTLFFRYCYAVLLG